MNKTLAFAAFGTIIIDLAAVAVGALYVHQKTQELEAEVENAKSEMNKTVNKLGKVLSAFEL